MNPKCHFALLVTFGTTMLSAAAQADVVFSDATLNSADYASTIYSTDPSVSIQVATLAVGGNPDSALQVRFTNQGGPINLASTEGFINSAWVYNPATQGALSSLDFSHDRYVAFGQPLNSVLTTFTRPLLQQGGNYFFATLTEAQIRDSWYGSGGNGLVSSDFVEFDFTTGVADATVHPDFSSAGGALSLGFAGRFNLNTAGNNFALDGEFRFDNLNIVLHNAPAVPEPASLALALVGLVAAGARRRKPTSARG